MASKSLNAYFGKPISQGKIVLALLVRSMTRVGPRCQVRVADCQALCFPLPLRLMFELLDYFGFKAFQDMNFAALRAPPRENAPRVCVFQNADPAEPMNPFELLIGYEEHGRVMPVVSGKFIKTVLGYAHFYCSLPPIKRRFGLFSCRHKRCSLHIAIATRSVGYSSLVCN